MKSPKMPFRAILVCSTTLGLNVTLAKVLVCPTTVEGGGEASPVEIKPQYYKFFPLSYSTHSITVETGYSTVTD